MVICLFQLHVGRVVFQSHVGGGAPLAQAANAPLLQESLCHLWASVSCEVSAPPALALVMVGVVAEDLPARLLAGCPVPVR
eukprot:7591499-Pyramimonas_sp.AAC.1